MSKSEDLQAKARHYRELATMLDEHTATICRDLADRYDREAADDEGPPGDSVQPRPA